MNLHPKIKAAIFAALAIAVVSVGNSILDVYGNTAYGPFIGAAIAAIAGYLKSSDA